RARMLGSPLGADRAHLPRCGRFGNARGLWCLCPGYGERTTYSGPAVTGPVVIRAFTASLCSFWLRAGYCN
ncbi:MAG TPA: hypothetical protein VEJ84_20780, partial [Acidimicrobiales bacterium]|nr:hypothetical protein [Acidimicrobiales bacterium]